MSEIENIKEGFNTGYIIQQHRPETFKIIEDSTKDTELSFFEAFKKGGETFTKDKLKSLMKNHDFKIPDSKPKTKSNTKDDPEIDMDN